MNEQEMFLRVGELAGRVGYPMPTINWVEGVAGEDCIRLTLNPAGAAILTVHDHVGEVHSVEEQEVLITQLLVHARLRVDRWAKRRRSIEWGLVAVLGLVGGVVSNRVTDNWWLGWFGAFLILPVAFLLGHLLASFVLVRRFFRRADPALVEVVGRDRVVAWLTSHLAEKMPSGWQYRLRWLLAGWPPSAAERLRMLGEKVAAA
ncbi:hypothetical protein [Kribbella sp. NPDC051718]|uniref:hypothetical protein n=1 Tax=Kribbella sp. NPDC051718 TaxID=3155168 RepID=UPI003433C3AF